MARIYSIATLQKLIDNASNAGYTVVPVSGGTLGLGHVLLIAPVPGYYSFEIMEKYSNEWSSVYTLRRFTKISKRIQALADGRDA